MKNVRAVICDVYRTILEVLPAPADAEQRWHALSSGFPSGPGSLAEVGQRCREIVASDHALAKARGIAFPEVVWPDVIARALPELARLDAETREDFLFQHMQLLRGLRLMPGAAEFLRGCAARGIVLGIASNAQRYTLREISEALAPAGLGIELFDLELTMWSWRLGFSKPNSHVFQMLAARLAHRGIRADEVLMAGDREDNDIAPARAFGWHTARITGEADWRELTAKIL